MLTFRPRLAPKSGVVALLALLVACSGPLDAEDEGDRPNVDGAEGGEAPLAGGRKSSSDGGTASSGGRGGGKASGGVASTTGGRGDVGGLGGEAPVGNGGAGNPRPSSGGDANGTGAGGGGVSGGSSGGGSPAAMGGSGTGGTPTQPVLRNYLPCDVELIIGGICRNCHDPNGLAQEPSLMTWEDASFEAGTILDVLSDDYMPYGGPALSSEQKQIISDWVGTGTPAVVAEVPPDCAP